MLAELAGDHPQVEETFGEASEALGYDLWALTQEGPEARLNATEQTQPAMLAAGVAVARVWQSAGGPMPARWRKPSRAQTRRAPDAPSSCR